jgi:hypothetical protein
MEVVITPREKKMADQVDALNTLRQNQKAALAGDKKAIAMVDANKEKGAKVPAHEQHLIHIATLTRTLSADQKSFIDQRRVIPVNTRNFNQMIKDGAFAAFDEAKVIHDPRPDAPREYALKPVDLSTSAAMPVNDAALAAKEQKLAEREKKIDAALAMLADKEKAIDAKLAQMNKAPEKQAPAKPVQPQAKQAPPAQGETNTSDLPNLDNLNEGQGAQQ